MNSYKKLKGFIEEIGVAEITRFKRDVNWFSFTVRITSRHTGRDLHTDLYLRDAQSLYARARILAAGYHELTGA